MAAPNGTAILRELLSASGAVWTIVGDRIYAKVLPPNTFRVGRTDQPAITIDRISGARVPTHNQATTLFVPRYQVTCWAWTYAEAQALAGAVNDVLDSFGGIVQGAEVLIRMIDDPPEILEPTTGLYQIPLDARVALSTA